MYEKTVTYLPCYQLLRFTSSFSINQRIVCLYKNLQFEAT